MRTNTNLKSKVIINALYNNIQNRCKKNYTVLIAFFNEYNQGIKVGKVRKFCFENIINYIK